MTESRSLRTVGLLGSFAVLLGAALAAAFLSGADIVVLQAMFVLAFPVLVVIVVRELGS